MNDSAYHRAVRYGACVIATAVAVLAILLVTAGREFVVTIPSAAILLAGGIGAFVQTFRVYRDGGPWIVWQGAGWLLFLLAIAYVGMYSAMLAQA